MSSPIIAVGPRPTAQRRGLRTWMLAAIVAVAQGLAPVPVQAAPALSPSLSQGMAAHVPGSSVPVGVWTSQAGESQDAFMLRLAVPMHAFTDRTGFEACGLIQHEIGGSRMRVYVTSNQSQIGCASVTVDDPSFALPSRPETIHTHPGGHSITPNVNDAALFSGYLPGRERYDLHSNQFSDRDFAVGPGYVVIPGAEVFGHPRLLHEDHGPETVSDLGRLPKLDLADVPPDSTDFEVSPITQRVAQAASTSPSKDSPVSRPLMASARPR